MIVKMLSITQFLLILFTDLVFCFPNNYHHSLRYNSKSTNTPVYTSDYYYRNQRYPNYNRVFYPSSGQSLSPEQYYPVYYVSPNLPKYNPYVSDVPYNYEYEPVSRSKYDYYYDYGNSNLDEREKMIQKMAREQRERSQPIGHEIRYENDYISDDDYDASLDDTKAAFMNNLMMYHNSLDPKSPNYYYQFPYNDYSTDEDVNPITYPILDEVPYDRPVNIEDEDVKELQELPKKQKQPKKKQRKQRKQKVVSNDNPLKRSGGDDVTVLTDRKPVVKDVFPTETPSLPAEAARRDVRGQKEEVLMRPATPVRHPFSSAVLDMLSKQEERKRSPSVYDTIRHMLEMEKINEENQRELSIDDGDMKPTMKKRIVSSEDSLTRQLSVLKKAK